MIIIPKVNPIIFQYNVYTTTSPGFEHPSKLANGHHRKNLRPDGFISISMFKSMQGLRD
jgi:hypothetical protein